MVTARKPNSSQVSGTSSLTNREVGGVLGHFEVGRAPEISDESVPERVRGVSDVVAQQGELHFIHRQRQVISFDENLVPNPNGSQEGKSGVDGVQGVKQFGRLFRSVADDGEDSTDRYLVAIDTSPESGTSKMNGIVAFGIWCRFVNAGQPLNEGLEMGSRDVGLQAHDLIMSEIRRRIGNDSEHEEAPRIAEHIDCDIVNGCVLGRGSHSVDKHHDTGDR